VSNPADNLPRFAQVVLLLLCTLCAGPFAGADAPPAPAREVTVTEHGSQSAEAPGGRRQQRQEIELKAGEVHYVLHFRNTEYLDKTGKVTKTLASIGVQCVTGGRGRHQGVGWYPNETMRVYANDRDLTATGGKLRTAQILGRGSVGLVEVLLEHPLTTVRLRFALRPDQEGLDVLLAYDPGAEIRSPRVRLASYPAFFTAWNKRRGDRWVATPKRAVEEPREPGLDMGARKWEHQVREVSLDPAAEWWLFYYDKFFNSDKGRGKGLCGLVLLPGALQRIDLSVSDYEISTALLLQPDRRVFRFTLWQRNVRDFGKPLSEFPAIAGSARERLGRRRLFSPPGLATFDAEEETGGLQALTVDPAEPGGLRAQLQRAGAAVAAWRAAEEPEALQLESKATAAVRDYRRAIWQARRQTPRQLRLLAALGAHFPAWRLAEATELCPEGAVLDASHFAVSWRGEWLSTFPATPEEMVRYDAVVLINVSATPFEGPRGELLRDFVHAGGGLVVLGGFYAYGGGGYAQSALHDLLPVECAGPFDVKRLDSPAPLALGAELPGLTADFNADLGAVMWLHALRPKPGAQTALNARTPGGPQPFLVVGAHGQGRVAACAGTVYGVGADGKPLFWETPAWPDVLARTIGWVCDAGSRTAP